MELIDGKYEVIEKIRDGGMGSIFKVRHALLGEIRVMKTLRGQFQDNELARQRFFREARLATSLRHPNIATVHDFSEAPDHTFLMIMEYIEGQNLAELLSAGPPPVATVVAVAIQALDALGYLHRKGIVHRDVSPENLMMATDERGELLVKLIDLGVARGDKGADELTGTGILVGKLSYMSPEQLTLGVGERLDGRADLYSFGCVLYRLLTGVYAVEATTLQSYIMAHVHKPPRPFEESDPRGRVPSDLRSAVNRALAKDRKDRWATAEEFRDALLPIHDRLVKLAPGPEAEPADSAGLRTERVDLDPGLLPTASVTTRPPPPPKVERPSVSREARRPAPLVPVRPGSAGERPSFPAEVAPEEVPAGGVPASRTGTPRLVTWIVGGTGVLLLAVLASLFLSRRRVQDMVQPGTLSVSVAPWGRVVSIRTPEGRSVASVPEAGEATPTQFSLPPGAYLIVVRGPVRGRDVEVSASATIKPDGDTPLRLTLPGFEVEEFIRSYVH